MAVGRNSLAVEEQTYRRTRLRSTKRRPRRWILVTLVVVLAATLGGTALYFTGYLNPFARVATMASLPAPLPGAAYAHLAVDATGWVWVAQSAPGLAGQPDDTTLLTLINPDMLWGNPVQARLCIGCPGNVASGATPIPRLTRVDDIAPDPTHPHSLYIAGWTLPTTDAASVPVVMHIDWRTGSSACTAHSACLGAAVILAPATLVTSIPDPNKHHGLPVTAPLLSPLLGIGVHPVLALATSAHGQLFCFISDRGSPDLHDALTGVLGGFQALLSYDPSLTAWTEQYVGPGGTVMAQRLSPTSTVSAMVADAAGHTLYLADSDHQAIYRLDLRNPTLHSPNPLIAASAVTRIAGAPLDQSQPGVDVAQGIPGWQGDGGPAATARLNGVRGLTLDAVGDLLVSDAGNARVRVITPQGKIWTVAGRGAAVVDGDGGAPSASGLRGLLGIANGTRRRVYVVQGAATDGRGSIRVRVLTWGWSTSVGQGVRATTSGQSITPEVLAGLTSNSAQSGSAQVITSSGCGDSACAAPMLVTDAAVPYQNTLAAPGPYVPENGQSASMPLGGNDAQVAVAVPGTPLSVIGLANPPELVVVPLQSTTAPAIPIAVPLPTGSRPTGIAFLAPATDVQQAKLGATYIVVATQATPGSAAVLIYKATTDTCGLGPVVAGCQRFPGAPQLVTTIPLDGMTTTGGIATALSDDATHAFVLVAHPMDNQVSALDLTGWLADRVAPVVAARVAISSPGNIVLRHDTLAAYITAGDGTVAQVDMAEWLAKGVPTTLTNDAVTLVTLNAPQTLTTRLALASDDSHLFAASHDSQGRTTLVNLNAGTYGQLAPLHVLGSVTIPASAVDLALTPDDARLLLLTTTAGATAPGQLHAWATHDPAQPDHWLDVPLDLGMTPTAHDPRALVALPE